MDFAEPKETKTNKRTKKKELAKLRKLYKKVPENVRKLTEPLMENAAFMAEQLDTLQDQIITAGSWIETYRNGANQTGKKMSAEGQAYNTLIKNYTTVISKLYSYLPQDVTNSETDDAFIAYIKNRSK